MEAIECTRHELHKRLVIDRTLLDDKQRLAFQGELFFQEFEQDLLKLDVVTLEVTDEMARVELEVLSVQNQLVAMETSLGASFWPKKYFTRLLLISKLILIELSRLGLAHGVGEGFISTILLLRPTKTCITPSVLLRFLKRLRNVTLVNNSFTWIGGQVGI